MLSFLAHTTVEANRSLLQEALSERVGALPTETLRYFASLNAIQGHQLPIDGLDAAAATPALTFALDADTRRFVAHMMQRPEFPEVSVYSLDEQRATEAKARDAFAIVDRFSPEALATVRGLVARFIFAKSPVSAGGSVGDTLGQVWMSPAAKWPALKIAECIWHETTHQALFLADMLEPVFRFAADEDKPLIVSAIRRQPRPYDLSFHAACVGAALCDFYRTLRMPEQAAVFAPALAVTIDEFCARSEYLTDYGCSLLEEMVAAQDEGSPCFLPSVGAEPVPAFDH